MSAYLNMLLILCVLNVALSVPADLKLGYKNVYLNAAVSTIYPLLVYWLLANQTLTSNNRIFQIIMNVVAIVLMYGRTWFMYDMIGSDKEIRMIETFCDDLENHNKMVDKFPNQLCKGELKIEDTIGVITGMDLLSITSIVNKSYFNLVMEDSNEKLVFLNYIGDIEPYAVNDENFEFDKIIFVTEDFIKSNVNVYNLYSYKLLVNKFKFGCALLLKEMTDSIDPYETKGAMFDTSKISNV